MEVRVSRRHRANKQQCREGTEASGDVAAKILWHAKRDRQQVCRENIDGDDESAPARARYDGISDGAL